MIRAKCLGYACAPRPCPIGITGTIREVDFVHSHPTEDKFSGLLAVCFPDVASILEDSSTTLRPRSGQASFFTAVRRAMWWMLSWGSIRRTIDLVRRDERETPRERKVYLALALLMCAGLAGPMSVCELAGAPLIAYFFIRAARLGRTWLIVPARPIPALVLVFAAWIVFSLLWSPNVAHGLDELGTLRWLWLILVLYPVLGHRRAIITALAIGFLLGQASQAWHIASPRLGLDSPWDRAPGRYSGWWSPVSGGTILVACLGLHLPAAIKGRGWERLFGIGGSAFAALGLLATGTRGAWIAGALLVGFAGVWAVWTSPHRVRDAVVIGVLVVGAMVVVLAAPPLRSAVALRYEAGVAEVSRALTERDFTSDTGARILMNAKAVEAWLSSPYAGVGAGGYRAWVEQDLRANGIDPATRSIHDHAHNGLLHILATTGLVGAGIVGVVLVAAVRGALWHARRSPGDGYALAPLFALLGLVLVSSFDPIHVNSQSSAMLFLMLALCIAPYPRPRERR